MVMSKSMTGSLDTFDQYEAWYYPIETRHYGEQSMTKVTLSIAVSILNGVKCIRDVDMVYVSIIRDA